MPNPKKRRDRIARLDRIGWFLLIVCAILAIALIIEAIRPDPESVLTDRIAVLIDPTDTLNVRQSRDAVLEVLRLIESAPEYAEISLYQVSGDVQFSIQRNFHVRKPHHPDSIGWFKSLSVNKKIIARNYEEEFKTPLSENLGGLLTGMGARQSPIIKTLQNISIDAFGSFSGVGRRQLIIVSDMVQHSDDWSFFRDPANFEAFLRHPNYRTMKAPDLGAYR